MKRPVGVAVLAVLSIVGGILELLYVAATVLGGPGGIASLTEPRNVGVFLLLFFSGLWLTFGIGAWRLRSWAWPLGIFVQVFSLVVAIAEIILENRAPGVGGAGVRIFLASIVLVYMLLPATRKAFRPIMAA